MPKFVWGASSSHSMTLTQGRTGIKPDYTQSRNQLRAASGKVEQINIHGIQEVECDLYITQDQYRTAVAWWSWARQGKSFAFAYSGSNTGNTTLASSVAASATSVNVSGSGTSFVAGDTVLIRSASSDDTYELAKISAVSLSTVTLTAGTLYAYNSGGVFRHYDYYPDVITLDDSFNPRQLDSGRFTHSIRFVENL